MELKTLSDIFNKRILRIPDYQRGYAWSLVQLGEFWEDLINLPDGHDHYTGMISLQKLDNKVVQEWQDVQWKLGQDFHGYHVVDGQQRLTTCAILIQAIIEFVEERAKTKEDQFINKSHISAIRSQFLYDIDKSTEGGVTTFLFGYEKDNPSSDFFIKRILNAEVDSGVEETFYTLNLEKAKNFFIEQLQEIYESYGDDDTGHKKGLQEIQEIYKKLTQNMKFNLYIIENDVDVFVTFETMNNRGKRLSTLELLKNRLIYLSTLFDVDEPSKDKLRREINLTWQTVYKYLGQNKDCPMSDDSFLREHCVVYFGYGKKQRKFDEFLLKHYFTQKRLLAKTVNIVDDEPGFDEKQTEDGDDEIDEAAANQEVPDKLTYTDVLNYVRSLRVTSKYWYDLYFPDQSNLPEEIKVWLRRLLHCQSANFRPLVFALLSRGDITNEEKVECLKRIEEFIFFYFSLNGYLASYQRTVYFNFAHELFIGEPVLDKIMERLANISCLQTQDDGRRVLVMSEVINRIKKLFNYDGYYSWSARQYFLYEYEEYLKTLHRDTGRGFSYDVFAARESADGAGNSRKMSVEHIFPQTPDKNDTSDDAWMKVFGEYDAKQQKVLNGTLGNLVLLSLLENISVQNKRFSQKCAQRYMFGSIAESRLCYDSDGQLRKTWDANCILQRGIEMLDFMAKRWHFDFNHEYDKVRLLQLEFLREQPDDYAELEVTAGVPAKTKNKITSEMISLSYKLSKAIFEGIMNEKEAQQKLCAIGMNPSSAIMYLSCFNEMMEGKVYKRQVSAAAADYFVKHITADYGIEYGEKAKQSVSLSRQYLEQFKS